MQIQIEEDADMEGLDLGQELKDGNRAFLREYDQ